MGNVLTRDGYLVIQNEDNPNFHWGNYILFKNAPKNGDFDKWMSIFKKEFPFYKEHTHFLFSWVEQKIGEVGEFKAHGFDIDEAVVLTCQNILKPKNLNEKISIRKINSFDEWKRVIELQIKCADPKYANDQYRKFKTVQMGQYRTMCEAGQGFWFGAFFDDDLIADLGIFFDKDVARFQSVETHPDFRKQGVCTTMVYEVSTMAFDIFNAKTLVMEADPHYHAAKIYEKLGFVCTEKNFALSWFKR